MGDRFKLLLRATSVLLLAGGVALFVATLRAGRDADLAGRDDIAPPAMLLLVCVGSAAALWAVSLVSVGQQRTAAEQAEATRLAQDVTAALVRLDGVAGALDRLARDVRATKNGTPRSIAATAPQEHLPASLDPALLERFERSLQEVRELAMLTESERQRRFDVARSTRRVDGVNALLRLIDEHKFAAADRLFGELCREYPGDLDVAGGGKQLSAARQRYQSEAVATEASMIEIDLSAGAWEDALRRSQQLVAEYPGSDAAVSLLARVRRDHAAWRETLAQSLFDNLRQQIDQRGWRVALATAQQLLKEFPAHNLAEQVSRQIALIQSNAEIEQRQEQEIHIRELIRSRQFSEAIEQAEDLLRRFPLSPQAEAIDVLLPRIRELAIQEETSTAS
jgi:hypothetical protein